MTFNRSPDIPLSFKVAHIHQMTKYKLERDLLNGSWNVPNTLLPHEGAQRVWRTPVEELRLVSQ